MATTPELNEDFLDLLRALLAAGAEFLIVGAHALSAHGISRATGDLDVLVRPSPPNARRVVDALRAFGAPLSAHGVTASYFEEPGQVYQMGLPPRRIDLLTSIDGVAFDEAASTGITVSLDGLELPVLGRAALIKNKRAVGRPKDLVDVEALERSAAGGE